MAFICKEKKCHKCIASSNHHHHHQRATMALHINMTILNRFTAAPSRKYPFISVLYIRYTRCTWLFLVQQHQHPFAMDRFARAFRFHHHPLQIVRRLMRIRTQVICKWIQNSTSIYNLKWCHSGVRVFCARVAHSRTCHILTCNFILYIYIFMYVFIGAKTE